MERMRAVDRVGLAGRSALNLRRLEAGRPQSEDNGFQPPGQVAARQGLHFGFAVDPRFLDGGLRYAAFLAHQANIVVPENALKWASAHPAPDRYDFAQADIVASFAHIRAGIRSAGIVRSQHG